MAAVSGLELRELPDNEERSRDVVRRVPEDDGKCVRFGLGVDCGSTSGRMIPAETNTFVGLSIYFSISRSLFQLKFLSNNEATSG